MQRAFTLFSHQNMDIVIESRYINTTCGISLDFTKDDIMFLNVHDVNDGCTVEELTDKNTLFTFGPYCGKTRGQWIDCDRESLLRLMETDKLS